MVPIRFMTVVLRKDAIDRVYPGGREAFRQSHPHDEDEHLVALSFMASSYVETFESSLAAIGFVRGRDYAIGEMFHGELLACDGVRFRQPRGFMTPWEAHGGSEGEEAGRLTP